MKNRDYGRWSNQSESRCSYDYGHTKLTRTETASRLVGALSLALVVLVICYFIWQFTR